MIEKNEDPSIATGGGASVGGGVEAGGGFTGRDDQRYSQRSGNNYYGNDGGSQQWIIAQIMDHAQQIRELTRRLDDLPNKFVRLKAVVDDQVDKVKDLEEIEVLVDKEYTTVRQPPPHAVTISEQTLMLMLLVVVAVIAILVLYLILR